MTPELAIVLIVATLALVEGALVLLLTYDRLAEDEEAPLGEPSADDPERDLLEWEWRLRMADLPEAYWY